MAVNTFAQFLIPGSHVGGTGYSYPGGSLDPEGRPDILWGQGTPDGDRAPFNIVNKGSLYMQVNASDDGSTVWVKVDEGGDNDDWKPLGGSNIAKSKTFNIDNGSGTTDDDVIIVPDRAILIVDVKRVYTEATDTAGVASANTKLGTAAGGAQIVAAAACVVSKAVGDADDLTIVSGVVAADGAVFVRHTGVATTEAGQYFVQIEYY